MLTGKEGKAPGPGSLSSMRGWKRTPRCGTGPLRALRILDDNGAHDSRFEQHLAPLFSGLIVRLDRPRHVRRAAGNKHHDLAPHILAGQIVVVAFGYGQPVTHKHQASLDTGGRLRTYAEGGVFPELQRLHLAIAEQVKPRVAFIDLGHAEVDWLAIAVYSSRLQTRCAELLGHVVRGLFKPAASCASTFEVIGGQKLHVRPPLFPERVPVGALGKNCDPGKDQGERDKR